MSAAQQEELWTRWRAGVAVRAIAARLGCAPSTVSREVARNGGPPRYRATRGDAAA